MRALAVLRQGMGEGDFFLGDQFTLVDIFTAHTLRWAAKAHIPLEDPALQDYLARMEARPAFARTAQKERLPLSQAKV